MTPKRGADDKFSALNKALRGMFKSLQARPVPGHINSVVDQLDEGGDSQLKKSG
ncbi:hypothetical protein [Phenylobacterium hankyongense]|uniref:hypothetical protein n=1 Tax=Phenylobacterium hankyongense TaxID=1813876 RepID=UPI00140333EA|nr:hypothetical protein [Phenylobacterium hankyongense]